MIDKISVAEKFATKKHGEINQVRKYTGEPYITHPLAVAELVKNHGGSEAMICAALLHDTVEDTKTTLAEINDTFGDDVAILVESLSDVAVAGDGNRAFRMNMNLEHTALGSADAHTIKLADLIDNSKSIIEFDQKFAKIYMKEKENLLLVLRDGNKELYDIAKQIIDDYKHD